ncbi:MAG: hypothetical protein ACD_20C00346G0001 [uncultured bacterium]|nr:MAG: hypothetical protein ACD_20C00346G0001 [uncultured bacterium]HBH18452.1 hypothetical protein [Cyanobacteria bacterium UBA9579]
MKIEYVTMIKDYNYDRKKGIKRLFNEIEDKLVCALCIEKVTENFKKVKGHDPFAYQTVWNLS